MSKTVKETGHRNLEPPVGVNKGCGLCPSGCRTVCLRKNMVSNDIVDGEMDDFGLVPLNMDHGSFRRSK